MSIDWSSVSAGMYYISAVFLPYLEMIFYIYKFVSLITLFLIKMEMMDAQLARNYMYVVCVVLGFDGEQLKVLLQQCSGEDVGERSPGMKLPGSMLYQGEGLDDVARRVLFCLTGRKKPLIMQLKTFAPLDMDAGSDDLDISITLTMIPMKQFTSILLASCLCCSMANAKEYHVAVTGSDAGAGTSAEPFKTINRAAQAALPGDTVTVHAGTYREWVNPLNGGESEHKRILYRAADGEKVEIKGSELVTGWQKDKKAKGVWKVVLPNSFFGNYNPFNDRLYGDWFWSDRIHHTADVFLNDVSLYEAASLEKVYTPDTIRTKRDPQGCTRVWFAEVDADNTTVYANFGQVNPNKETVEVSVRPTCFYPTRTGLNYITIRGFHISQAATQWAAPTAEQVGMVSTHWCKGWIIEDNVIRNSRANGITLGKERGSGHNLDCTDHRLDGTLHYVEVIFNALRRGWSKENVGSHIVRNNVISDCEQTGICGSMGGAFSEIYGNDIYNILVKQQFGGAEMAGIKLHGAIDTYIHHNRIHHNGYYGIWLDWMAQGAHISSNLIYDNSATDLFFEVSHGPYVVDNNICLSAYSIRENTDGGAYINNVFAGLIDRLDDSRYTPYHLLHSTEVKGICTITEGDHRFYNNIFVGGNNASAPYGMVVFDASRRPIYAQDNLFLNGAMPMSNKQQEHVEKDVNPNIRIEETPAGEAYLVSDVALEQLSAFKGLPVDAARLGITQLTGFPYEHANGTPMNVDMDYFGQKRGSTPTVGPVETLPSGKRIKVWPSLHQ